MNGTEPTTMRVVADFSLMNCRLLYTSITLAPSRFMSGVGGNCPSNLGFLAFEYYTQLAWHRSVRAKELHARSLLVPHFITIYVTTYLSG
jgi:hypothetical protein